MASSSRVAFSLLGMVAFFLLPLASRAQHTCVYCSGGNEFPDPSTTRISCTRNATSPLTCPDTGTVPDCDDASIFSPDMGNSVSSCELTLPTVTTRGSRTRTSTIYECSDMVTFQSKQWELRAVIPSAACPDQGSIWTECSALTPLCQPRYGVRSVPLGGAQGFQAAADVIGAGGVQVPAAEESAVVAGLQTAVLQAAPGAEALRAPVAEPAGTTATVPLRSTTTLGPGGTD